MRNDGHWVDSFAIRDEWVDEFPFLRLAIGSAAPIRPIARVSPATLRVPEFCICMTSLGNLTAAYPHLVSHDGSDMENASLNICGCDTDPKLACVKAVAEAVERYASVAYNADAVLTATAHELGADAMEWSRLPKGAAHEYARDDAICTPFAPDARIGWVPGTSLLTGRKTYVPAALAYVNYTDDAQYWIPITTGMAAHSSVEQAAVHAICEVIERDAIALTWLLKLPLARLRIDNAPSLAVQETWDAVSRSGVRHLLFDATTDIGVPTVYAVQLRDGDPLCSTVVSCATSFDGYDAAAKTVRECAATSLTFENDTRVLESPDLFVNLEDGATYMSRPARRDAFRFLTDSRSSAPMPAMHPMPQDAGGQLRVLRDAFAALDREVVLVDMTPEDVRSYGLVVVRAVIPDLMPMSCVTRFRYLGHPRLFDYARRCGIDAARPGAINPLPQPFA